MCQVPHICDFSPPGAACPVPGKHRWIPDGEVLPSRPAPTLPNAPLQARARGRLPAPCLRRAARAPRQLMSPSAHLPAPRRRLTPAPPTHRDVYGRRQPGLCKRAAPSTGDRPASPCTDGRSLRLFWLAFFFFFFASQSRVSCWVKQRINFPKVSPRT